MCHTCWIIHIRVVLQDPLPIELYNEDVPAMQMSLFKTMFSTVTCSKYELYIICVDMYLTMKKKTFLYDYHRKEVLCIGGFSP